MSDKNVFVVIGQRNIEGDGLICACELKEDAERMVVAILKNGTFKDLDRLFIYKTKLEGDCFGLDGPSDGGPVLVAKVERYG